MIADQRAYRRREAAIANAHADAEQHQTAKALRGAAQRGHYAEQADAGRDEAGAAAMSARRASGKPIRV